MKRLLVLATLLFASTAHATKPCPQNPCTDPPIDGMSCDSSAAWIAVGTITKVVHHPSTIQDHAYDFFDADLTVDRWEKGSGPKVVHLVSRWCWLQPDLATKKGPVRVYGLDAASEKEVRYLFAEAGTPRVAPSATPSSTTSSAPDASAPIASAPDASAPAASAAPASIAPSASSAPVAPPVPTSEPGPRGSRCGCDVPGSGADRSAAALLIVAALIASRRRVVG